MKLKMARYPGAAPGKLSFGDSTALLAPTLSCVKCGRRRGPDCRSPPSLQQRTNTVAEGYSVAIGFRGGRFSVSGHTFQQALELLFLKSLLCLWKQSAGWDLSPFLSKSCSAVSGITWMRSFFLCHCAFGCLGSLSRCSGFQQKTLLAAGKQGFGNFISPNLGFLLAGWFPFTAKVT